MIKGAPQPLTAAEDGDMRTWLGKSGGQLMRKVVESKMYAAQLKHLEQAMESSQFPLKLEASSDDLKAALRYQTFLEIWQELNDHPTDQPFEILKLNQ